MRETSTTLFKFKFILLCLFIHLSCWTLAQASDLNPSVIQKNYIQQAIQISITPRGMKYFENNLLDVLHANGIEIGEGFFPPIKNVADKSIPWDQMGSTPEQKEIVQKVRQLLNQWLVGFNLNEVRPGFEVSNGFYQAKFEKLGIVADQEALRRLGKTDGVVIAVDVSIKDLRIGAEQISAWDANNEFLGRLGAEFVSIEKQSGAPSLSVRLPFYARVERNGNIQLEALGIETNLDQINIDVTWHRIMVPTIAVEINGNRFEFNKSELEKELKNSMPKLVIQAREAAKKFADSNFTEILNEQIRKQLTSQLEEVNRIDPPGGEACSTPLDRQLMWGLKISSLQHNNNLNVKLDAFMEDPTMPRTPFDPKMNARGAPELKGLANNSYDVAMSLDRGFINRMLLHSFNRKLFENIPLDDSKPNAPGLRLLAPPVLDYMPLPAGVRSNPFEAYVKIQTKVKMPKKFVSGFAEMFVDDAPAFELTLVAKIKKIPYKGLQLSLWDIVEESIVIDSKSLTVLGRISKGLVMNKVRSEVKKVTREWQSKDTLLVDEPLPFPPTLLEIHFDIARLEMDPRGHLVLYLQYSDRGIEGGRECSQQR